MAFDPVKKLLYVLDVNNHTLSVVTENGKYIKNIPVGMAPFNIKYNKNNHKIYVANLDSDSISVINVRDLNLATPKNIVVGANPSDMTIDNTTNDVYIVSAKSKSVTVLNGTSDKVKETFHIFAGNIHDSPLTVAFDDKAHELYVTTQNNMLYKFNSQHTYDNFTNINVGNYPKSIAYNDKTKEILVANYFSDSLSVIDPQTNTTKKSY